MCISDWSSDVCSSDLALARGESLHGHRLVEFHHRLAGAHLEEAPQVRHQVLVADPGENAHPAPADRHVVELGITEADRLHGQRPAAYRMLGGGEEGRLETMDAQAVRRGALGKQAQVEIGRAWSRERVGQY